MVVQVHVADTNTQNVNIYYRFELFGIRKGSFWAPFFLV
ncbi:hypothetical protein BDW_01740 [Bdellovibrio bacteriovorus W]|nr:hypothetical protein BDW_01740 [Bdellovibrio bacteriovorus W]